MRIEDYWNDGFSYYVEFQILRGGQSIRIKKLIITLEELSKEEVEEKIFEKFSCVKKVYIIDEFEYALIEKLDRCP
ncbi:MAG: hypothetical protein RR545_06940 [Carnobacterium sp.]|uniref:hypothetical protein n=1 Tax=Carnobacterium sp. TaxID=48221 RepID=UPI002FCA6ED4